MEQIGEVKHRIPHHITHDVMFDLWKQERLVVSCNWTDLGREELSAVMTKFMASFVSGELNHNQEFIPEPMATRADTKLIIELWYSLRMLTVQMDGPAMM